MMDVKVISIYLFVENDCNEELRFCPMTSEDYPVSMFVHIHGGQGKIIPTTPLIPVKRVIGSSVLNSHLVDLFI